MELPKKTALYEEHLALCGRMIEFAGYLLPVQYDGIGPIKEHEAVRESCGIFDIDHMAKVLVTGEEVLPFLQNTLSRDIKKIQPNGALYAMMLNEDGGVIDDIFVYKVNDGYMLILNADNHKKDVDWIFEQSLFYDVLIMDMSDDLYMIAVQGPKSTEILSKVMDTDDLDLGTVEFHTLSIGHIDGVEVLFAATGYTGEYGFELFFEKGKAVDIWRKILNVSKGEVTPCGLAARDSLRFEACMPLYGHELSENINPLTAGLSFSIDLGKNKFIGKEPLLKLKKDGVKQKLVGIEMVDTAVPRADYEVYADNKKIGWVTSGMKSPTLGKFLAMAIIDSEYSNIGAEVQIKVRDSFKAAKVVKKPFYTPTYRKNK